MANTTEVRINGRSYTLRASNLAAQAYADRFWDPDGGRYTGSLSHDGAQLFSDIVTAGEPNDAGEQTYVVSLDRVPSRIWGILWALAVGGHSTTLSYDKWFEREVADELADPGELAEVCGEVIDLVTGAFFREREELQRSEPAGEE